MDSKCVWMMEDPSNEGNRNSCVSNAVTSEGKQQNDYTVSHKKYIRLVQDTCLSIYGYNFATRSSTSTDKTRK